MMNYKHFIPPLVPTVGADAGSAFAWLMQTRLRNNRVARNKAALVDGEDEVGSTAASDASVPRS